MGENDIVKELEMELDDGRIVRLKEIEQWLVYDGLLDGYPTERLNDCLVDHIMASSAAGGRRAVLITPEQIRSVGLGGTAAGEEPATLLPRTAIRARFDSLEPLAGGGDFSELSVIWFQHSWALPIDGGVVEKIRAIDWAGSARDMIW